METFSAALSDGKLGSLEDLYFSNNQIDSRGIKAFCTAISNGALKSLKCLSLVGNQIDDEGFQKLSEALSDTALPMLNELFIEFNPTSARVHIINNRPSIYDLVVY